MQQIPINLAVEDFLSEAVLRRIIRFTKRPYVIGTCFCKGGYGYLKKNIQGFNHAAKTTPFLVLTDLDNRECPPELIQDWLPYPKHPNLLFRVAVREVEAWLLAHREAFAKFLGVSLSSIPTNVDTINDPKQFLLSLVKKSKKRQIRDAIAPAPDSTARIGPDYNGQLGFFVQASWNVAIAMKYSPSLLRTVNVVKDFNPQWHIR